MFFVVSHDSYHKNSRTVVQFWPKNVIWTKTKKLILGENRADIMCNAQRNRLMDYYVTANTISSKRSCMIIISLRSY